MLPCPVTQYSIPVWKAEECSIDNLEKGKGHKTLHPKTGTSQIWYLLFSPSNGSDRHLIVARQDVRLDEIYQSLLQRRRFVMLQQRLRG